MCIIYVHYFIDNANKIRSDIASTLFPVPGTKNPAEIPAKDIQNQKVVDIKDLEGF